MDALVLLSAQLQRGWGGVGGVFGDGRPRTLSPERSLFALMNTTSTPLQHGGGERERRLGY